MSVLVKGMKMPDSCYHCKIAESCGHYIYNYTNRRHPDCPLIALPDHHGRLVEFIDVDEVLDEDSGTTEVCLGDVFRAYLEMRDAPTIVESEDSE